MPNNDEMVRALRAQQIDPRRSEGFPNFSDQEFGFNPQAFGAWLRDLQPSGNVQDRRLGSGWRPRPLIMERPLPLPAPGDAAGLSQALGLNFLEQRLQGHR